MDLKIIINILLAITFIIAVPGALGMYKDIPKLNIVMMLVSFSLFCISVILYIVKINM